MEELTAGCRRLEEERPTRLGVPPSYLNKAAKYASAIHSLLLAELGSENLRTMIYILQAYVLLSPTDFVVATGAKINECLQVHIHICSNYAELTMLSEVFRVRFLYTSISSLRPLSRFFMLSRGW